MIHIGLCTDNRYAMPCGVCVTSLFEPTLKSKIIDFSDCTTTDFRAAMAMEFYSIKCQFLIRT